MLALVLVFSLSATAFATEDTGSITITNATIGDTYRLYKIFEATYLPDGDDQDENPDGVSYTLTDEDIYNYMFGGSDATVNEEVGTRSNAFFTYTDATKLIVRNENTQNSAIFEYLTTMIRSLDPDGTGYLEIAENVTSSTVVFDDLGYGYYLIDKGNSSAVTITSNTPDVQVIDKNQIPGSDFSKTVKGEDESEFKSETSANIGDIVTFKVEFEATNYDGEDQIQYYSIMDTKGDAIWVEFNNIEVYVNGVKLNRGHYHGVEGSHATGEWTWLGDWTGVEQTPDNAEWYLIHYNFDKFQIVIPWMSGHDFTGTSNGFTLTYGENADSIYGSPVDVMMTYTASVEPGASIGNPANNNLWNSAELSWTYDGDSDGPQDPSITTITTYALGLNKIDADTKGRLADAVFTLWSDEACTEPVYVIPTGIDGVYILDDLTTAVSGRKRESSRELYKDYLEEYLGDNYATTQKNEVTSEINGKFLILGLEEGNYYLKETVAPNGYNILPTPHMVSVGETSNTFFVVHDAEGNVVDMQEAAEGYQKTTYTATSTTVENSKGVELPSTGGKGTVMMITFGTMIAMAFAVLLITQKKMSIYHD